MPIGKGKRSKKIVCRSKNTAAAKKLYDEYVAQQKIADEAAAQASIEAAREFKTVRATIEKQWAIDKPRLAGTSQHLYQSSLDVHIYQDEAFCDNDVYLLSTDDVKAFLARTRSSENVQNRLFKHLKWFLRKVNLPEKPFDLAKDEKPKASKSEAVALEPEEEQQLLKYVMTNDEIFRPIIIFLLDTGVRSNELLGLKWSAISFTKGVCHIRHTLDMVNYKPVLKTGAKTPKSVRPIHLSAFTLETLKALRAKTKGQDNDYVFPGGDGPGGCWNRYKFSRRFAKLMEAAGLPAFTPHVTRHTVATRLINAGMPLPAISKKLGHANSEITLKIYAHAFDKDEKRLASEFDYLIEAMNLPTNLPTEGAA